MTTRKWRDISRSDFRAALGANLTDKLNSLKTFTKTIDSKLSNNQQDVQSVRQVNILTSVHDFLNDPLVKKVIKIGSDVATAIVPFAEEPTTWNGLKSAFLVGKSFVDSFEIWAHDYFDDESKWIEPYTRDFTGAIIRVLRKYPYETIKTASEGYVVHLVNFDGAKVGWVTNTKLNYKVDRVYAELDKVQFVREKIKKLLWDQFGTKPMVLRRNSTNIRNYEEDRVVIEVDDSFDPLPSARATEYAKYLTRCITAGVNRSVMLYGPPGTGKSTMARTLVEALNLRSFRVRVEDVGHIDNSTLYEAINVFNPEAIILDDFDRSGDQQSLLETLHYFHKNVKLVIATVNDRDALDEALLRPGRFDELVLVNRMDDDVIKKVLGPNNEKSFDLVKEWPIAFIQEFVKRRTFMSEKEANESIKELAARVERLTVYNDDDASFATQLARVKGKSKIKQPKKNNKKKITKDEINAALSEFNDIIDDVDDE